MHSCYKIVFSQSFDIYKEAVQFISSSYFNTQNFDHQHDSVTLLKAKSFYMSDELINKVSLSPLSTLDLEDYYPKEEIMVFDLKPHLFMELILKEKDFRSALQLTDWEQYRNKIVAVTCTADAVIPMWAYMLVASYLQPVAADIIYGDQQSVRKQLFLKRIDRIDMSQFDDKRVVVKGCGDIAIDEFAYMEITKKLRPVAKSIMYGEPCSTVPIYKKK